MKSQFFVLLFLLTPIFAVLSRANEYNNALLHFQRGNAYYERARFDSAAFEYEAILNDSLTSDLLYYNLANAYFRMQQYPRAILNYERAIKLNPNNENAKFNLALANSFTVDKIEQSESSPITTLWNNFRNIFQSATWSVVAFVALGLALLFILGLRFFVTRQLFLRLLFLPIMTGFIALAAFILSFDAKARANNHNAAIIMQSVVAVKSSPNEGAKDLFLLHAGTKVNILQKIGEWYEIAIPDGHQGWIELSIVQHI